MSTLESGGTDTEILTTGNPLSSEVQVLKGVDLVLLYTYFGYHIGAKDLERVRPLLSVDPLDPAMQEVLSPLVTAEIQNRAFRGKVPARRADAATAIESLIARTEGSRKRRTHDDPRLREVLLQ